MLILLAFSILATNYAFAGTRITKTVDGIKATVTVSPKMLDIFLTDAKTGKTITNAKVKAIIVHPDGHKVNKELVGMKMGEVFSYMNSVDTSPRGTYAFHIAIETDKKTIHFQVKSEVK